MCCPYFGHQVPPLRSTAPGQHQFGRNEDGGGNIEHEAQLAEGVICADDFKSCHQVIGRLLG